MKTETFLARIIKELALILKVPKGKSIIKHAKVIMKKLEKQP